MSHSETRWRGLDGVRETGPAHAANVERPERRAQKKTGPSMKKRDRVQREKKGRAADNGGRSRHTKSGENQMWFITLTKGREERSSIQDFKAASVRTKGDGATVCLTLLQCRPSPSKQGGVPSNLRKKHHQTVGCKGKQKSRRAGGTPFHEEKGLSRRSWKAVKGKVGIGWGSTGEHNETVVGWSHTNSRTPAEEKEENRRCRGRGSPVREPP